MAAFLSIPCSAHIIIWEYLRVFFYIIFYDIIQMSSELFLFVRCIVRLAASVSLPCWFSQWLKAYTMLMHHLNIHGKAAAITTKCRKYGLCVELAYYPFTLFGSAINNVELWGFFKKKLSFSYFDFLLFFLYCSMLTLFKAVYCCDLIRVTDHSFFRLDARSWCNGRITNISSDHFSYRSPFFCHLPTFNCIIFWK